MNGHNGLKVGISPCPNDSYIFGAWILGFVPDVIGTRTRFFWEDVQTLNEKAGQGDGDVLKVSAAVAVHLPREYKILEAGGAFGLQHGPKLITRSDFCGRPESIAVPGMDTSAYAFLQAAFDGDFIPRPMPFDQIIPAVQKGKVQGGVLIHEAALIFEQHGLQLFLDLGEWWFQNSGGLPIPLGCIVAREKKDPFGIERTIKQSIDYARNNPHDIFPLASGLAQELSADVLHKHIKAYVNDFSYKMGGKGKESLEFLKAMSSPF